MVKRENKKVNKQENNKTKRNRKGQKKKRAKHVNQSNKKKGGKKEWQNEYKMGGKKGGGVWKTIALRHWQDVGCLEKQLQAAWRRLWPALRTRSTISKASMFNSSRRALRFASFFTNEVANACSTRCFQNKGNKSPSRCAANRNTLRQLL